MDPNADRLEWNSMLEGQRVEGEGMCRGNERCQFFESLRTGEPRLEGIETVYLLVFLYTYKRSRPTFQQPSSSCL